MTQNNMPEQYDQDLETRFILTEEGAEYLTEVSREVHPVESPKAGLRGKPRGLMQVETIAPERSNLLEEGSDPLGKTEDRLVERSETGSDPHGGDQVGPCQTEESKEVTPGSAFGGTIQSASGGLSLAGATSIDPNKVRPAPLRGVNSAFSASPNRSDLVTNESNLVRIRHKLPNWAGYALALAILPLLFFALGRATSSKSDASAYYNQAKEQILGLAASPKPKSSPQDYLTEAREAFKRAQEISQEKELSDEDKNKVTNLINLAIQTLSDGIAKYPNEAALYFERAQIYKAISQATPEAKEKAKQDLKTALELAPNDANILAFYGRSLVEEGNVEKAKGVFNQLLQILPKNSQDYQTVSGWLKQLDSTQETIRDREQSFDPGSKSEPTAVVGPEETLPEPVNLESGSATQAGEISEKDTSEVKSEDSEVESGVPSRSESPQPGNPANITTPEKELEGEVTPTPLDTKDLTGQESSPSATPTPIGV